MNQRRQPSSTSISSDLAVFRQPVDSIEASKALNFSPGSRLAFGFEDREAKPLSGGKADFRYLIDSYLDWAAGQAIPVAEGLGVDLDRVATAPWSRLGGGARAAFVHLQGRGDFLALQLIEIPPGAQMDWSRHLYDEVFYVLSGRGHTSIAASASRAFH